LDELKNYRILSHIGKGSFSIVSMAINTTTNKKYAIKTYQKIDQIEIGKFENIEK
jgi:serine/threonine protein kinase